MGKLDFLIKYLLKESKEINIRKIPTDIIEKKNLYRSLCNIREAKPISGEYLKVENEYLQEELKNKNVTENIETSKIYDKIYLWKGDITTLKIKAIVNAANSAGLRLLCSLP